MIPLVVCAIIGFVLGMEREGDYCTDQRFQGLIIGIVFGVAAAFLIGICNTTTSQDISRSNLGDLNDGTTTQGQFFLGTGTIDDKQVYSYYKETGPSQYKLSRIDADGDDGSYDVLVQEDSTTPYVETIGRKDIPHVNPWWGFGIPIYTLDHVIFHVPKGSIKSDVKLDAQ